MVAEKNTLNKKEYILPSRNFEDSGIVYPEESYYVPFQSVTNVKKQDIKTIIDKGRYFSIFAPRQSGKTTFLEQMCHQLHQDKTYISILLSFQNLKDVDKNPFYKNIEKQLYKKLKKRLQVVKCDKYDIVEIFLENHHLTDHLSFMEFFWEINKIIEYKKIVIFIDEFDGIPLGELESFLTTLRTLYLEYKNTRKKALYSVGLVGIRNITKLTVGGVSPFNIADQVDLPSFTLDNVRDLFAQYTEETNQPLTEDAIKMIHEETSGQPWLVNRLGTILTVNIKPETTDPIEAGEVKKAIQMLLMERNAHFDNLYEKAKQHKETFVMIVFDNVKYNPDDEDQTWLEQYGLIKRRDRKAVVANNIYKERYLETFFSESKLNEDIQLSYYTNPGEILNMNRVLLDFGKYITQIGVRAFYQTEKPYEKTGQFLLTAWLYQFERGGQGDVRYEVRSGLGRMDILLTYKQKKYIIETKVNRYADMEGTIEEGIQQLTLKYMASEEVENSFLVIFDVQTPVGTPCKPQIHENEEKKITIFNIGIGKTGNS
jgi:hypothetical protein